MQFFKKSSPIVVGMALFAMFFGSGNLTFPMYIGQLAQKNWLIAAIGFCISAVLLPFLGILAMMYHNGDSEKFFHKAGKYLGGKWLIPLFLTAWIPLGSAPRCITVAYGAIKPFLPSLPLWAFSLLFCLLIFSFLYQKKRLINILGNILTPLLLLALIILVVVGIIQKPTLPTLNTIAASKTFFTSLFEGYNTMDLIAACFFASSIIKILSSPGKEKQETKISFRFLIKSSIIGVVILAIVYFGMISLSASYFFKIQTLGKEEMFPFLAHSLLGSKFGIISSIIVLLACCTTLVALVIVYADYLEKLPIKFLKKKKMGTITAFAIIYFFSLLGFEKIGNMIEPVLQVLYPVLITLVSVTLIKQRIRKKASLLET